MAATTADLSHLATGYDDRSSLDEFRLETLRAVIPGVVVLAVAYDLWLAARPDQRPAAAWPLDVGLIALAAAAALLSRLGVTLAGLILSLGLALSLVAATYLHPAEPIPCGFALLVMLIAALHGWPIGTLSALACSAVVAWLPGAPGFQVTPAVAGTAIVLIWLGVILAWLSARPTELALRWAWFSYVQELKALETVRDRQAELARLNRSLTDACKQLAAANQELDRSRRAAVAARQLRDRFAATVSHEMRTPLNLIIGFSEVMVETPEVYYGEKLPRSYQEDVRAIYRNACHLSQLVDDILDLAQIEANHLALDKSWASVAEIVEEAVLATRGLFATKGLELRNEVPRDLPPVLVDRTRLRQIIINLLSNAARFTRVGGITIAASEADREIVVRVRDTGSGIPKEYLQQIFEEFAQVDTPFRRDAGGTGLGLTISKRLVELHGGNLWAESDPGRGSTFSVSLPKQANVAAASARSAWDTWVRLPDRGGPAPAVLLLTDDAFSTQLLRRHVEGYRVMTATTPRQARRVVMHARPMAVIAIGADPDELRRQFDPARLPGGIPVISCIADGPPAAKRDLGVHAYLTKPVTRAKLRSILDGLPRDAGSCLIVDDDPEIVRLFARFVRASRPGWQVRTAEDGAEVLELLRTWHPGLVLLDLLMPGVDGYAVLRAIQGDPRLRDVPIVVISAKGLADERFRASQLTIRSPRGIAAADLVRYLKAGLDLLASSAPETNDLPVAPNGRSMAAPWPQDGPGGSARRL